eukprot:g2227.t1
MLPSHHGKPRTGGRTTSVYVCSVASLALCLMLTLIYWRWEVNSVINLNEQIRKDLSELKKEATLKVAELEKLAGDLKILQGEKDDSERALAQSKDELAKVRELYEKLQSELESSDAKLTNVTKENEEYNRKFEVLKAEFEELDRKRSEEIRNLQMQLESTKESTKKRDTVKSAYYRKEISGQTEGVHTTTETEESPTVRTGMKNPRTGDHNVMKEGMLTHTEIEDV